MTKKFKLKIAVDLSMQVIMLLLMSYALIGEDTHEWLGTLMGIIVVAHNLLNINWYKNLFKGKYSVYRLVQTIVNLSILLCMIGLMYSGIVLSQEVFTFLPITSGRSLARIIHLLASYWGFALMAIHLGLHWTMFINMAQRIIKKPTKLRTIVVRTLTAIIAIYGVYALITREVLSYMFMRTTFVFFDYNEAYIFFVIDYIAIMALFICVGHYGAKWIKKL